MKYLCLLLTATAYSLPSTAQQPPAPPQAESILIIGATAHIGDGEVVENSAVGFRDGKIDYAGSSNEVSADSYDRVIDATGKHVYPGFIAANTSLGLTEIDAVKASVDHAEMGDITPHVRSLIAYNTESRVVESMRPNGVLMAQIAPRSGRISGTSSVVQLDAWNWEDAVVRADGGIHMSWPATFSHSGGWMSGPVRYSPNKDYAKQVTEIRDFFAEARAYSKGHQNPKHLPYESVRGLFDGTAKLYITANGQREITDAILTAKKLGIQQVVLVGAEEADRITDLLLEHDVAVLVGRPHRLPSIEDSHIAHPFALAAILSNKGVLVSIDPSGDMERMNTRNLPFYAGTCAAYGLDREKAVQLITANAAKILGIDDFAGTLKPGKDATLFISEGDALDMRTNRLTHAFIQGRGISLETHQTALWKLYSGKLGVAEDTGKQ